MVRALVALIILAPLQSFALYGGLLLRDQSRSEFKNLYKYTAQIEIHRTVGWSGTAVDSCTGSIVAQKTIALAAHCVDESRGAILAVKVKFLDASGFYHDSQFVSSIAKLPGTKSLDAKGDAPLEIDATYDNGQIRIKKWTGPQPGDLALLQLESEIPKGYLPMTVDFSSSPKQLQSKELFKIGFGTSERMMLERKIGRSSIQFAKDGFLLSTPSITDGRTCGGDSGGGVVYFDKDEPVLIGVITGSIVFPQSSQKLCDGSTQIEFISAIKPNGTWFSSAIELFEK